VDGLRPRHNAFNSQMKLAIGLVFDKVGETGRFQLIVSLGINGRFALALARPSLRLKIAVGLVFDNVGKTAVFS